MAPALEELLAEFFVRDASSTTISALAVRALERGVDSPSLRVLAGLTGYVSPFELEALIDRMLSELGEARPSRTTLLGALARPHAEAFLAGQLGPADFTRRLYELSHHDPREDAHHPWCELDDLSELEAEGIGHDREEALAQIRAEARRLTGQR